MSNDFYVENDVYIIIPKAEFEIAILAGENLSLDKFNDNVDVEIRYKDERLLTATFLRPKTFNRFLRKTKKQVNVIQDYIFTVAT